MAILPVHGEFVICRHWMPKRDLGNGGRQAFRSIIEVTHSALGSDNRLRSVESSFPTQFSMQAVEFTSGIGSHPHEDATKIRENFNSLILQVSYSILCWLESKKTLHRRPLPKKPTGISIALPQVGAAPPSGGAHWPIACNHLSVISC
jgi:hypothetical protein